MKRLKRILLISFGVVLLSALTFYIVILKSGTEVVVVAKDDIAKSATMQTYVPLLIVKPVPKLFVPKNAIIPTDPRLNIIAENRRITHFIKKGEVITYDDFQK